MIEKICISYCRYHSAAWVVHRSQQHKPLGPPEWSFCVDAEYKPSAAVFPGWRQQHLLLAILLMNHILTGTDCCATSHFNQLQSLFAFFPLKTEHATSFTLLLATFAPQFEIFLYGNFTTADTHPHTHLLQVDYFNRYLYRWGLNILSYTFC